MKRIYVPNQQHLKNLIFEEYHKIPYAAHHGYQKMISAMRNEFFWPSMKKEVAKYLAKCLKCQQVKAKHQHPTGLLHPLPIPKWKWETISIDFITKLPRSRKHNDSIMVVVEKLRKYSRFIPVQSTYRVAQITKFFAEHF